MRKNRKMSESRRPSVSFTAMPPGVLVNDSRSNSTDDIQIALAPHIQTYLSQTGRRHSCCSVMLPVAFERASSKSWMDPKFDSPVLEGQFQTSVFPHVRMRYRFSLSFILICSFSLFLYFLTNGDSDHHRRPISSAFSMLSHITATPLGFTRWDMYRAYRILTSAFKVFSSLVHFSISVSPQYRCNYDLGHSVQSPIQCSLKSPRLGQGGGIK